MSEKLDRQALLLRARKRIEEKRLFQQVRLEPSDWKDTSNTDDSRVSLIPRTIPKPTTIDLNSIPLPAARYRRVSLNTSARSLPFISRPRSLSQNYDAEGTSSYLENPSLIAIPKISGATTEKNMPTPLRIQIESPQDESLENLQSNNAIGAPISRPNTPHSIPLTIRISNDNLESPTSKTSFFESKVKSASRDALGYVIDKKIERILEKGVSMSPANVGDVEYTGLSVIPATPRVETSQEKKRKGILMKRGKKAPMPDDTPLKEEGKY